jgi:phosphohistidine swiveling domain-containing protein
VESGRDFFDPLRGPERSARFWSTVNAAEALPGVPTPLNWTWYDEGTDNAMRRGEISIGTLPRSTQSGIDRDQRYLGIFHGHAAVNVDLWRRMADAVPGTSGAAFERDILGAERTEVSSRTRWERYPFVALMAAPAFARARRRLAEGAEEHHRWWRGAVAGVAQSDERDARAVLDAAFRDYEEVATAHLVATIAAQGLFDTLGKVCARLGWPGLERGLTTGLGTEEAAMIRGLWDISRGQDTIERFVGRYGYQGPGAGEIANASWRETPAMLEPVVERYRGMPEDAGPAEVERRQLAERAAARQRLRRSAPALARPAVSGLLRLTYAFLPLRESGRGTILRSVDVARAAAKVVGARAAGAGLMHQPDDVFMCTLAELAGRAPMPGGDELSFRRGRWEAYHQVEIPAAWQGVPAASPVAKMDGAGPARLAGIGASEGTCEGLVRVVEDPTVDPELEPGEILVCHTTDPSWASLFLYAGAVVIDIGGPMSHGAIVARELGIPCVINTKDGTRRLQTGDRVRVDGGAGTVDRVNPPGG